MQTGEMNNTKPTIIALYGLKGAGKSYHLNTLKTDLDASQWFLEDGSAVFDSIAKSNGYPGGCEQLKEMTAEDKNRFRALSIEKIREECRRTGRSAVITGHLILCNHSEGMEPEFVNIAVEEDWNTYTHFIYLNYDCKKIQDQARNDNIKDRPAHDIETLEKWQRKELSALREMCRIHSITLSVLQSDDHALLEAIVGNSSQFGEEKNLLNALIDVDRAMADHSGVEKLLLIDGDRTLCSTDTGEHFWRLFTDENIGGDAVRSLKDVFSGPDPYSFQNFHEAMLSYEEAFRGCETAYDKNCETVARTTVVHPEFTALLQLIQQSDSVKAIIVTSGIRQIWQKIVEKENLNVQLIGGNRISDGYVVSPEVKQQIVARIQGHHQKHVVSFGDSPLDLPMLHAADTAFVVVGDEKSRSKTMEEELFKAIKTGLRARQILLPGTVSPRASSSDLPIIDMTQSEFIKELLGDSISGSDAPLRIHGNVNAQKILSTPTRTKSIEGMQLREAHRSHARHLAVEHLSVMLGVESYKMPHICDGLPPADGHRILHGDKSTIVAVMRAGEPMAAGVADVLPKAMYVHAHDAADVKMHHVRGQYNMILVDGVINTGKTIREFIAHIRKLHASIRVIVLCGVLQADAMKNGQFRGFGNVEFVASRTSETKYTGNGGNDTGNRLFNTTHLLKSDK